MKTREYFFLKNFTTKPFYSYFKRVIMIIIQSAKRFGDVKY